MSAVTVAEQPYLKHIQKSQINPYRLGAELIYHRIKYDLRMLFNVENKRKISKLRDIRRGDSCVILCNGPSLNKVDFDLLNRSKVFTIGLNKINLLFNRTSYRPDLIVCVNPYVIKQNEDFFSETNIPLFLDYTGIKSNGYSMSRFNKHNQLHIMHSTNVVGKFAGDLTGSICQGSTVTYVALQIAYHIGFKYVTLVGCDHNFDTKGSPNQTIKLKGTDNNHFDPNYFSTSDSWQLPNLLGSEYHYQVAREVFLHNQRQIFNSTEGGNLELFERISLKSFLNFNSINY